MARCFLDLPPAFLPLLEPKRYKVLYGGRASTKSWSIARVLLAQGAEHRKRVLCAREIQNSIAESVHELLTEQIGLLGLSDFYQIQKTAIVGANGSEFFYSGLKHKIDSLKSLEGVDVAWVEEAQLVSTTSWNKLTPTIRKPGSEIWISFNPELDTDATYQRFVLHPPDDAWVQKVSYKDNPWFSDESAGEMRQTRRRSEDDYQHIWLGFTKQALEGAVYANEMRAARADGRVTKVPYDLAHPVNTYWDFGHHDATAIWFIQKVGFEYRVIDYYENRQQLLPHYIGALQERKYNYGVDYMPHDADSHQGLSNTIAKRFKDLTGRTPIVLPRDNPTNGIDALRTVFPQMWFDEERCADGLHALRHYAYAVSEEDGHFSSAPVHDWSSHGADALRCFSMSNRAPRHRPDLKLIGNTARRPALRLGRPGSAAQSWMGR